MKKIISIFAIVTLLTVLIFTENSYAAGLDTIDVQTDKTTVRPGEEVKVTVQFGQDLGKYTFNVAYDNNIFDYVSAEGGTDNNTGDKVKVTLRFRGREMSHMANSRHILDDYAEKLADIATVDKPAKVEGRSLVMFLTEKRN